LTKDEVIRLSESLLFIFRNEPGDSYLAAVSRFILNAYEFGDATAPETSLPEETTPVDADEATASEARQRANSLQGPHNLPYLSLATFRMVVLADELLEGFFGNDLAASFQLEDTEEVDYHKTHAKPDGLLGGLVNLVVNDENKSRFNRLADGIGSALGKHAEWRKPSLSKADPNAPAPVEVRARESLLTPSSTTRMRSTSTASQISVQSVKTSASSSTVNTLNISTTPVDLRSSDVGRRLREESEMVRAAQEAVMHRPNFAIDAIGDSDGEDEDEGGEDDGIMDEVEAFLKAHGGPDDENAVKGEQKKMAKGEFKDCTGIISLGWN
jgi:hypothetical protein